MAIRAILRRGRDAHGTSASAMAILAMLGHGRDARGTSSCGTSARATAPTGLSLPLFHHLKGSQNHGRRQLCQMILG